MRNQRRKQYRRGDILIEDADQLPVDAKPQTRLRQLVVAEGEATGHHHVLLPRRKDMDWWQNPEGDIYVRSAEAGRLVHEEHGTIEILTDAPFIVCRRQVEFMVNYVAQQVAD
jgi:hypothetical protein